MYQPLCDLSTKTAELLLRTAKPCAPRTRKPQLYGASSCMAFRLRNVSRVNNIRDFKIQRRGR